MHDPSDLPEGTFEAALRTHLALQEQRVRRMYNRTRAVFAESIAAALLPGASVIEDPAAAWDITWPRPAKPTVRIEVKCSGEHLPRLPNNRTKAEWSFPIPNSGWHPDELRKLEKARHCDVLVLARHEGPEIDRGWRFYVLLPRQITRDQRVGLSHLAKMGAVRCDGEDLEATIEAALDAG